MTSAFSDVLARPWSIAARRALLHEWTRTGDPRSELLAHELALHDGPIIDSADDTRVAIDSLLRTHRRAWIGRVGELAETVRIDYGLPAAIGIRGDALLDHAQELFSIAPIIQVTVTPPVNVAALLKLPQVSQLRGLFITGMVDEDARLVAKCAALRGLRCAAFKDKIGIDGLRQLCSSEFLRDITYIDVTGNPGIHHSHTQPPCSGHPVLRLEEFRRGEDYVAYLLGTSAEPSWSEAAYRSSISYTCEPPMWPPPDEHLIYSEQ